MSLWISLLKCACEGVCVWRVGAELDSFKALHSSGVELRNSSSGFSRGLLPLLV